MTIWYLDTVSYGQFTSQTHNQSVLALRLCGRLLERDVPEGSKRTDFAHEVWTKLEETMGIGMTVDHYNALLAVYLENKWDFKVNFG